MSSGSLFFKKLTRRPSPPLMSVAAEVRAASTAAGSSGYSKTATTSSDQGVRHSVAKDKQPEAKRGLSSPLDGRTVAKDRAEKLCGKASPKANEKQVQRRLSEVGFVIEASSSFSVFQLLPCL